MVSAPDQWPVQALTLIRLGGVHRQPAPGRSVLTPSSYDAGELFPVSAACWRERPVTATYTAQRGDTFCLAHAHRGRGA